MRTLLALFVGLGLGAGAVWIYTRYANDPRLQSAGQRFTALAENFRTPYLALAGALRDKPYFVDLRNALTSRVEPAYQADGVHLTDSGRVMVARSMLPHLRRKLGVD